MKRTYWLVAAITVFTLVLASCAAPAAPTAAPTTPPEQPAPTTAPMVVRVATDATWPPFEMVDEATKEIIGLDIELVKAIAAAEGFEVEFVNVAFDPLLAGMAQCQYDAAVSAITITEDRKQQMLFSDPYFEAGQVVTVQAANTDILSKDDLTGKTVGAQLGTTGAMQAEAIEGVTLKSYDSIDLAFQDLMNGQIDAVIADNPLALGFIGKNADKIKAVGEVFTDEQYGIAVCNTNQDLLQKINSGLAKVKGQGLIDQLTKTWIESGS